MENRVNYKYSKAVLIMLVFGVMCIAGILWHGEDVYETVSTKNGPCVVIDSGHGGIDPGKVSADNIYEKDINLQIALKLKQMLEKADYQVIMTREEDEGLYSEGDTNKKMSDLQKRVAIMNEESVDAVVSIHQNSYSDISAKGAQVFYFSGAVQGEALAKTIQNSFAKMVDETNQRSPKGNNQYYLLKNVTAPMVIVECGFLSNPGEAKALSDSSYQEKVAKAICCGIQDYIGQKKGNTEGDGYKDSED